jgi:hypothetical protein
MPRGVRRLGVVLLCALALAGGIFTGIASRGRVAPTPLAQLGFALGQPDLTPDPAARRRLAGVARAVRQNWKERPEILDLVLTLRGVGSEGEVSWERATSLCEALGWPRCDRAALEELRRRSRP